MMFAPHQKPGAALYALARYGVVRQAMRVKYAHNAATNCREISRAYSRSVYQSGGSDSAGRSVLGAKKCLS
jgi:hypothetical protein